MTTEAGRAWVEESGNQWPLYQERILAIEAEARAESAERIRTLQVDMLDIADKARADALREREHREKTPHGEHWWRCMPISEAALAAAEAAPLDEKPVYPPCDGCGSTDRWLHKYRCKRYYGGAYLPE